MGNTNQTGLKNVKPKIELNHNIYKIPRANCLWSHIGETGRCLLTGKKEHTGSRNTKSFKKVKMLPPMHGCFMKCRTVDNFFFRILF